MDRVAVKNKRCRKMHKDARKYSSAKEDERKSIFHTVIARRSAKKKTERKKEKDE